MFWSFWTANRHNVEQVWKNQTSTCDFGRVKEVLIWYFGWLAKEIMGSLITALIFDLGFIGHNWRQWDCSDGTFYFVSVAMAKSLHNIFCCFWVCLKTASPKSLIYSNDYLHRNLTFDPWDSCESLQVQTGKCFTIAFSNLHMLPPLLFCLLWCLHPCGTRIPKKQLVMVYWGGQDPVEIQDAGTWEGKQINTVWSKACSTRLSGWRACLPTMTQAQHGWLAANTITGYKERAFLEYPFLLGTLHNLKMLSATFQHWQHYSKKVVD